MKIYGATSGKSQGISVIAFGSELRLRTEKQLVIF